MGTELLLATLSLMKIVALAGGVALLEHPQDPGGPPFPSIWDTDIMKETCEVIDFVDGNLDQCQHGQDARKATKIRMFGPSAVLPESMTHLRRRCTHKTHKTELAGLDDKVNFKTSAAQTYPSRLVPSARSDLPGSVYLHEGDGLRTRPGRQAASSTRLAVPRRSTTKSEARDEARCTNSCSSPSDALDSLIKMVFVLCGVLAQDRAHEHQRGPRHRRALAALGSIGQALRNPGAHLHGQHGGIRFPDGGKIIIASTSSTMSTSRSGDPRLRDQTTTTICSLRAEHLRRTITRAADRSGARNCGSPSRPPSSRRRTTRSIGRAPQARPIMRGLLWGLTITMTTNTHIATHACPCRWSRWGSRPW